MGEAQHAQGQGHRGNQRNHHRLTHALSGALGLLCAPVLPHKGGGGQRNALHGNKDESVQLAVAAVPRHARGAKGIDIRLDKHIGKRRNALLHRRGHANPKDLLQFPHADAQLPPADAVGALLAGQRHQHQQRRQSLGQNRGHCHTPHAHVKIYHKHQVEHRVDERGKHQEVQRSAGIPHRAENAAAHVVDQQSRHAGKVDGQISPGVGQHILRGVHHGQHGVNQQKPRGRGQQAQDKGDADGGMHRVMQPLVVVGAIGLGNHHAGAGGQSRAQAHHHVDNAARAAHGSQGLLAHKPADHQRIHRVIQLLEQKPDGHRHRKCHKLLPDDALRHIRVPAAHCTVLLLLL